MGTFLLGINYWPRRSAMYMWERFDLGEIREDFARIKSLGLHVARFFVAWDDFEPRPGEMDRAMLRRFEHVMDAAHAAAIQTMPTLFTGHMSGINYLPAWALDRDRPHGRFRTFARGMQQLPWGVKDFYEGEMLALCRRHVRAIAERVREHPALYCWDLGNEFSNLRGARSPQAAATYARTLADELREASGKGTCAGTHGEDLAYDRGIRPSTFCEPLDFAVMHGYSVYTEFARSRTDVEVVPFLCQIMQSMSGKPVLFDEFGNPTCPPGTVSQWDRFPPPGESPQKRARLAPNAAPFACLTQEEMSVYCYQVLDRLQRRGALGAFWWCWADYADNLRDTPPFDEALHELTFGIVRSDGSYKPVAKTLRDFAKEGRQTIPPPPPIVREADWYANLNKAYQSAVYHQYLMTYAGANAGA